MSRLQAQPMLFASLSPYQWEPLKTSLRWFLEIPSNVRAHQFNGGKTPNKAESIYWGNCSINVAKNA
jgi:hypothetical protein